MQYDQYSPLTAAAVGAGRKGLSGASDRLRIARQTNDRLQTCIAEGGGWLNEAYTAHRYYRSDQYRRYAHRSDRKRIRHVVNTIRRDVDLLVADVLDGEPVVNPVGRNPRHHQLGAQLLQLVDWSRDEEEDWDSDIERAIVDCFHTGEGVLFEGWDQDADGGQGLPVSMWLDSRYVFWDPKARRSPQRDDAEYVIWLEQERVERIEEMWPHLKGRVQAESIETFLSPTQATYYRNQRSTAVPLQGDHGSKEDQQAWIRRMWSRKHTYKKRYFLKADGTPAVAVIQGEEKPLTEEIYATLSPEEKDQVLVSRSHVEEIWETVVVNDHLVSHRLSPFDRSRGGHGKFPLAFFSYVRVADEARSRGEIGFLIGNQDVNNETVSLFLEQLHQSTVGFWHSYKGALPPEELAKVENIASRPHQHIQTTQGMPPPQHVGVDASGLQAAGQGLDRIRSWSDSVSGIKDPYRGQAPGSIQSGRAIRALQAQTNQLSTSAKRHIESGLRRATLLRLHNIMQFMRGNRVAEVTDPKTSEKRPLFIGHDEMEIALSYGLRQEMGEDGQPVWLTEDGKEADLFILNDEVVEDVVFERIKLTLDTGQEKNKLERMEQAEMFINVVGPDAIPWATEFLELPNADRLIEDMERGNTGKQLMAQMEAIAKQVGMEVPELMEMFTQLAQQQAAQAQAAPGEIPPQAAAPVPV